jgi:hypothetical protein
MFKLIVVEKVGFMALSTSAPKKLTRDALKLKFFMISDRGGGGAMLKIQELYPGKVEISPR